MGVGAGRNTGLEFASRAWCAFIDADDMWLPVHLEELSCIATKYPEAGLISGKCLDVYDEQIQTITDIGENSRIQKIDYFLKASHHIGFINSSSTAVRRDVYSQLGGFGDFKAGEDLEFWARVAYHYPVAISNRVTCLYFHNVSGAMAELDKLARPKVVKPISLRNISASVSFLCDMAESEPERWQEPSIRAYINSRVYYSIIGTLYEINVNKAKNLKILLLPSDEPRIILIKFCLIFPDIFIRVVLKYLVKLYSFVKYLRLKPI